MSRLLRHDRRQLAQYPSLVGIDEAGRGCLAGPVSAGAVWLDHTFFTSRARLALARAANDSKKMSPAAREEMYLALCEWESTGALRSAQATASVLEIGAYNILGATRLAMHRCLQMLAKTTVDACKPCPFLAAASGGDTPLFHIDETLWPRVLVDGRPLKPFAWQHTAIVGGDGKSLAIALASILAKVRRDKLMAEMDKLYPQYGFAIHKGYATPMHIEAIRKHGACPEHRPLFLRAILASVSGGIGGHPEFAF
ncbi:MAG: ribonuclease HII [Puniceicoccales bacterium]|jgi:ribonuclease HII|nr:ribonuclease HII [Puniceicoccales bacterium]